jgi:Domain of unknown function (DUF4253)
MGFFSKHKKADKKDAVLTSDEEELLKTLNIDNELGLAIKSKTDNRIEKLYELQEFDDYTEDPKVRGIKSLVDARTTMPNLYQNVKELQSNNTFKDYHILSCGSFGDDKDYFIGAIKTKDKYECLRIFETNGVNYNLETKDIIDFFQKWETQARFSIIDAYFDRVIIQLGDFDLDLDKFAKEALEFCPDFLSAVENEEQLKKYILDRKGEVDFWWD